VNKIQLVILISYLVMTANFMINWIRFSVRRQSYSPEDTFLSFVIFCITTILWPLVIPMSLFQILKTRKLEFDTAIPVVVGVLALTLSLYLSS
jgi:hypothetical protein